MIGWLRKPKPVIKPRPLGGENGPAPMDFSAVVKFPFPPPKDFFAFADRVSELTEDELREANGWPTR